MLKTKPTKKDVCAFAVTEWQKYVENWCIVTWHAGRRGGGLTVKIVYTLWFIIYYIMVYSMVYTLY